MANIKATSGLVREELERQRAWHCRDSVLFYDKGTGVLPLKCHSYWTHYDDLTGASWRLTSVVCDYWINSLLRLSDYLLITWNPLVTDSFPLKRPVIRKVFYTMTSSSIAMPKVPIGATAGYHYNWEVVTIGPVCGRYVEQHGHFMQCISFKINFD